MSDLFSEPGMFFPAIALWQPYASLPVVDAKPWETRGRPYPAKYHGRRIVVCSTKAFAPRSFITPALDDLCTATLGGDYKDALPRGHALYSIVLKGCERTEDMVHTVPPELLASGDFSPGRWAWEWGEVEPFNPFPVSCAQGWFRVTVPDGAFRCATLPAESGRGDGGPWPSTKAELRDMKSFRRSPSGDEEMSRDLTIVKRALARAHRKAVEKVERLSESV